MHVKKSRQLPLMIARGFEVMVNTLPKGVLVDAPRMEEALRQYRLRKDNHLTPAFSDMLKEVLACMDTRTLSEQEMVNVIVPMKEELDL
jgi:hypothetical protein